MSDRKEHNGFRGVYLVTRLIAYGMYPILFMSICVANFALGADFKKPYDGPRTERVNVFAFTQKPTCRYLGNDRYEISFSVKGHCDVTVSMVDGNGTVVRHLGSGVLGRNAPAPFAKGTLKQTIYWNGKDDLLRYVKQPEKLKVRVALGLNPTFDKRLGGTSPHNIPGQIFGLAVDQSGYYVWSVGKMYRNFLRKFDHDGNYIESVLPPKPGLSEEKRKGMGYVEFEKGKRAPYGPAVDKTLTGNGSHLPYTGTHGLASCQPVISQGRFYYANSVGVKGRSKVKNQKHTLLYYIGTDGSTDLNGSTGVSLLSKGTHSFPHLAASPDGKWIYMTQDIEGKSRAVNVVWRKEANSNEPAKAFIGIYRKPGSDNKHLGTPSGIDTDAKGRIYVCDMVNNRLQVFSADGVYKKTLAIDRPRLVSVHKKTGDVYVLHRARIKGRSVPRLSHVGTFEHLKPGAFVNKDATFMVVDSWSKKPRIMLGGDGELKFGPGGSAQAIAGLEGFQNDYKLSVKSGVTIWEHSGKSIKLVTGFNARAMKTDAKNWVGAWNGSGLGNKVFCDPVRETVYFGANKWIINNKVFDLKSGKPLHSLKFPGTIDDLSFDKRGYMHCHMDPGFYVPGVGRLDPESAKPYVGRRPSKVLPTITLKEVPYDYGIQSRGVWIGVVDVRDQAGAKFFQDGLGVNMQGDLAVESNIYYVPKFDDVGRNLFQAGTQAAAGRGEYVGGGAATYASFMKEIQERNKNGQKTYFFKREPGLPLNGPTVWTFESTGELRQEAAVIMQTVINNCQIDEDGKIYFVSKFPRVLGKRFFLQGQGGRYGVENDRVSANPYTGTLIKSDGGLVRVRKQNAIVKMTELPDRPADLSLHGFPNAFSEKNWSWVEGAEWLYAGASPLTDHGCSCPKQNFCIDWYKRSFLPEMYRYSIGVVDTAGNLILHIGKYGNFDNANKLGLTHVRFVSATDNYLVYEDGGERLVVVKLGYHAEETTSIKMK